MHSSDHSEYKNKKLRSPARYGKSEYVKLYRERSKSSSEDRQYPRYGHIAFTFFFVLIYN